jgi:uncharacterized lipoprotein YajG
MKYLLLLVVFLAGCAAQPTQCFHNVSPAISIASNDPRIPSVTVPARVVDVCITPGYVEKTTVEPK